MDPARWQRVREVLERVVEGPVEDRDLLLSELCRGDARLRDEVRGLLASHIEAGDFLETTLERGVRMDDLLRGNPMPQPDQRIGDYRIVRELGRGGMGAVYLAERFDEEFEHQVALKIAHQPLDGEYELQRFRQERQILASLEHENIARLFDGGTTDDGRPYFVMEYVQGLPLDRFCDESDSTIEERLRLFQQVCAAVQVAHQSLIVHRDLKPANILVTQRGVPKLLDFGIAKFLDPSTAPIPVAVTRTGVRPMTPDYASPEQIRNESITVASDVYSLGVILYVLVTGEWPYRLRSRSLDEISLAILEQEPIRPSVVVRRSADTSVEDLSLRRSRRRAAQRLRGDLDSIILRSLQKNPTHRYDSANQLAEDIQRELSGLTVQAREATLPYRLSKAVRRHWLSLTIVAVLTATTVGLLLQSARLQDALDELVQESQISQDRLAANHWAAARNAMEEDAWLEAALHFAEFASLETQDSDAIEVALTNVHSLLGGVELLKIIPWEDRQRGFFYSPDGRLFVTAARNELKIWDTRTGDLVSSLCHEWLRDAAFSPSGRFLVSWGGGTARLWDQDLSFTFEVDHDKYLCIPNFLNDESDLMLCNEDIVYFVETKSGNRSGVVLEHPGLQGAKLNSDRNLVVTFGKDATARIWNPTDGSLTVPPLEHPTPRFYAQFDPSGDSVITRHKIYQRIRFWDTTTGEAKSPLIALLRLGYDLSYSFDANRIYVIGGNQTRFHSPIPVWMGGDGRFEFRRISPSTVDGDILAIGGSRVLVVQHTEKELQLVDLDNNSVIARKPVSSPSKSILARTSHDGTLVVVEDGGLAQAYRFNDLVPAGMAAEIGVRPNSVRLSRDNNFLIAATDESSMRLWTRENGAPYTPELKHRKGQSRVESVVAGDHCSLVTWSSFAEARFWRLRGERLPVPILSSLDSGDSKPKKIFSQLARDGEALLVQIGDTFQVVGTRDEVITEAKTHPGLSLVRFSDDQRFIASLAPSDGRGKELRRQSQQPLRSRSQELRLWSVETGDQIGPERRVDFPVDEMKFSPCGEKILLRGKYPDETRLNTSRVKIQVLGVIETGDGKALEKEFDSSALIRSLTFSQTAESVFFSDNRSVWEWNLVRDEAIVRIDPLRSTLSLIAVGDSRLLLSFQNHSEIWDTRSWVQVGPPLFHSDFQGAKFSPTGQSVGIWHGETLSLWTFNKNGNLRKGAEIPAGPVGFSFSQDGSRILTWKGYEFQIWSAKDGTPVGRPLSMHQVAPSQAPRIPSTGGYRHFNDEYLAARRITSAALVEGGNALVALDIRGYAYRLDLPKDIELPAEYMGLLVEARTGVRLGTDGAAQLLEEDEWRQRRAEFQVIAEQSAQEIQSTNLGLQECRVSRNPSWPTTSEGDALKPFGTAAAAGIYVEQQPHPSGKSLESADEGRPSQSDQPSVRPSTPSDLSVEISDGEVRVSTGDTVHYRVIVYDQSRRVPDGGSRLEIEFPQAARYVPQGSSKRWTCSGGRCWMDLSPLESFYGEFYLELTVPDPSLLKSDHLEVRASVSVDDATGPDRNPSDNTDVEVTPIGLRWGAWSSDSD